MGFFERGLKAKVMSTELVMEADLPKKILFEAYEYVKKFEATFSAYRDDSLLNLINKNAGIKSVKCNNFALELFEEALNIAKISDGAFDPTIGALTQGLYGFGTSHQKIPSKKDIEDKKKLVDYKNFVINGDEVFLKQKGMRLDFGGIGKGYVAQKLIEFFRQKGAKKALVNVGGEICVFGKNYNIAVKNPYEDKNIAIVKTSKEAFSISTSGDYERYIKDKKYHHILDSKKATQNHFYSSITLLKNGFYGTLLDAVATIAFNLPESELEKIAKNMVLQ